MVEAQTPIPLAADDDAKHSPRTANQRRHCGPPNRRWTNRRSSRSITIRTPDTSSGRRSGGSGKLLKVRIQPRWKFTGVPPAEREHLRDEIDNLIGWLKAARADLEAE